MQDIHPARPSSECSIFGQPVVVSLREPDSYEQPRK